MTAHTKDALGCACILEVLNLSFAVAAAEACGTKGLVTRENGEVFDLVGADAAGVGAVVADERLVTKHQQIGIGVEERVACCTTETIEMPSAASYSGRGLVNHSQGCVCECECVLTAGDGEATVARIKGEMPAVTQEKNRAKQ